MQVTDPDIEHASGCIGTKAAYSLKGGRLSTKVLHYLLLKRPNPKLETILSK